MYYIFLIFFVQLKFLSFEFIIQIFYSLKEIIMIIKTYLTQLQLILLK